MNYIFQMETSKTPPGNAGLTELRAFLQNPEDGACIDVLQKYNLPVSFETKNFEDGSVFLFIDAGLNGFISDLDSAKLMPNIAAVLSKGMVPDWTPQAVQVQTTAEIIKKALANDDVFVIYGSKGIAKLFSELVSAILGQERTLLPTLPLDEYKSKLMAMFGTKNGLAKKLETAYSKFEESAQTHEGALKILGEIFAASIELQGGEYFHEIKNIMDAIGQGILEKKHKSHSIKPHISALPHNPAKYEDCGKLLLDDIIGRLREVAATHEEELLLERLEKLALNDTLDEAWFAELADTRKQLLLFYSPSHYPFISGEQRKHIMEVLSKAIQSETLTTGKQQTKTILTTYIESITENTLKKYRRPFDGTQPFLLGSTCIIDMDACTSGRAIKEAIYKSDKIIMLGSNLNELFHTALSGANEQSALDKKERVAICGMDSPNIKQVWYHPEKFSLLDFFSQTAGKMLSFGILTTSPWHDLEKMLDGSGIGSVVYKVGNLSELYYDVFDVLVWFVEPGEGEQMLSSAYARVSEVLVFVADADTLAPYSPLLGLYKQIPGDDVYGR